MKAIGKLIFPLLGALLCACSQKGSDGASGKPVLLASIEPQSELLRRLAGPDYEIVTVMDRSADAETFEPTPDKMRKAAKSEVYFSTGVLPFENSIVRSLPDSVRIVEATDGIDLIYGTHGDSGAPDPHLWTTPANLRKMAWHMAMMLTELQPDSLTVYAARYDALKNSLDSLDSAIRGKVTPDAFGVWHPSLSYFAREYGLRQCAVGHEHKESSPRQLREAIDALRAADVKVVFYENEAERGRVEAIADAIGARAVEINLMGPDIENELLKAADEISRP